MAGQVARTAFMERVSGLPAGVLSGCVAHAGPSFMAFSGVVPAVRFTQEKWRRFWGGVGAGRRGICRRKLLPGGEVACTVSGSGPVSGLV